MQKENGFLPRYINVDTDYTKLSPEESPFIKAMTSSINGNPNLGNGTNNPIGEGQNEEVLTPTRSNRELPTNLPAGYNKNVGTYESETTQELYTFNHNSNGQHGIYVISGDSLEWKTVIIDPELNFTDDQEAFIASHRVNLRAIYDKEKQVVEKYLLITDGTNWQKFISVIASIETQGFNATLYPYWELKQPHFDRRELFEWAVRPPMYKPIVSLLPNAGLPAGSISRVIDQSFQFAYNHTLTDGRFTTLSPYSLPMIFNSQDYLNNAENLPKRGKLVLDGGSALVERTNVYVRKCKGPWLLYDGVDKYTSCGDNSKEVIGNKYWLRTNPYAENNYNAVYNTFEFIFDNAKVAQITDPLTVNRLQTDMPQRSVSMTDLGDAALLGWNEYGYDNFDCNILNKLTVDVQEKQDETCNVPLRNVRLYAYVGRCGDDFNYCSQVAYFLGEDKTIRFGGLNQGISDTASLASGESTTFQLNFADKDAFTCYLKGTPYYTNGKWYQVNPDAGFSLDELAAPFDFSVQENLKAAQNLFNAGSFYICVFDLQVPAGRYIATLGRHNVASSGDYRNRSTYIVGIANSRDTMETGNNLTSIGTGSAIVSISKEMEIDCTAGDVDVWGNGADTFYVYCPYITGNGNQKFRFIEGYLYEEPTNPLPIELFPYNMTEGGIDDNGRVTDKNGFYFGYTKEADSDIKDIRINAKINCVDDSFVIPTVNKGSGWKQNNPSYLSNNNGGQVGDCNRIVYNGKITSLDGTINYSNIAISIKDGATVFTNPSGEFTLIIHNGQSTLRQSNVYINAGGNFLITTAGCGYLPLEYFDETLVPCVDCDERIYPTEILLGINVQVFSQTSIKEGGRYSIGIVGADLAGRLTFVNVIDEMTVPSFLERNNTNATYFQLLVDATLNLAQYPDIKWISPYISKDLTTTRYLQWVGDKIEYIDNNGNVTTSPSSAVFCAIFIDSLYNYNINSNFTVIANYQFVKGDRLRILDDGDGDLLDVAQYGDPIDVQIEGTNYNQALINAGVIPPLTNTVITPQTSELNTSVTLIVKYDPRLDKLIDKTGFWIEIYTPAQQAQDITYCEVAGFYPVINGKIANFTGFENQIPQYTYPTVLQMDFWDTYLFQRNITIPDVGNKFLAHPFESANITDSWGEDCSSCGRQQVKNDNARRQWYKDDTIKSDDFVQEGIINGLGTFRGSNRKNFKGYAWGGIIAMKSQRSVIAFICENDWFVTNFNFQYVFANESGVQIANLDNNLSEPLQKVGNIFGCALEDTSTVLMYDGVITWYDYKNSAWALFDYRQAIDISLNGLQSYLNVKTQFIKEWNRNVGNDKKFDVISGVDRERNKLYITFRPRRGNSNDPSSYVNQRRFWAIKHQETVVYSIEDKRWTRTEIFTPEAYGTLKGKSSGLELFSFAAGKPWQHKNVGNTSYLNFYGQTGEPVICGVINEATADVKILQSMSYDSTMKWFMDLIYSTQNNSFSYLPLNYFKEKEKMFYSDTLRDMMSYPSPDPDQLFRSMLIDGRRLFGVFLFFRVIGTPNEPNTYREMRNLYYLLTNSPNTKK